MLQKLDDPNYLITLKLLEKIQLFCKITVTFYIEFVDKRSTYFKIKFTSCFKRW